LAGYTPSILEISEAQLGQGSKGRTLFKSAVFLVMPEEDNTKYVIISLIVQQLYREILSVADEYGGKLPNRVKVH
jgi:hypothetical protein